MNYWHGTRMTLCACKNYGLFGNFQEAAYASYLRRKKNVYELLEIPYDADDEQIRNAFVRKSQQLHPDGKNYSPNRACEDKYALSLTEQFMQLKSAYDILRRPIRRKQYDRMMGIDRIKLRGKKMEEPLYGSGEDERSGFGYVFNTAMSVQDFIRNDPYVRAAQRSDNVLMYAAFGVTAIFMIGEAIYMRYLEVEVEEENSGPQNGTATNQ